MKSVIKIQDKIYEVERTGEDYTFSSENKIEFPTGMFRASVDEVEGIFELVEGTSEDLYLFSFAEVPESVISAERREAQLEYTAIMTGTSLGE